MRLHLRLTPNKEPVPFNYQHQLTGALHKWLGVNDLHDKISLYSFSWLRGKTERVDGGLNFPNGAKWFISFWESKYNSDLIRGIKSDPEIAFEFNVEEIAIEEEPEFKKQTTFFCASPILVKRREGDNEIHYTYSDPASNIYLTETLCSKLKKAGLPDQDVTVQFDRSYHSPKTKVIYYNNIGNRVNICPVKIQGTPEQIQFAWNVGVGNSTGIGFGALK